MRRLLAAPFLMLCLLWTATGYAAGSQGPKIDWQPWSDGVFERAARENRFVLLDLEAVWCHWCHVMDEVTYSDPKVVELIKSRYIPVRVDQDSRPDISRRYENYGWPATVVFNAEGGEIVKRRGYLAPPVMISMLEEIIVDPSPVDYGDNEPIAKFADNPLLSPKLRQSLERAFYETHDPKLGGQKQFQKFIDHDTAEYGLLRAGQGDKKAEEMTRRTLTAALKLVDPAWGGVYQYSTDSDWDHAHFEKIMAMQAEPLRLYALAYGQFRDERYLKAVRDIHRYVTTFLRSPEGAFYTSQDADLVKGKHSEKYFALDDAARRKLGIPAVDKHRYARENGWMIQALATAYTVTGERAYLDDAQRAARWIVANRSLAGGGFRHDEKDVAGPYLEDTLAMGDAIPGALRGDRRARMARARCSWRRFHRAAFPRRAAWLRDERSACGLAAAAEVEHRREHSAGSIRQPAASVHGRCALSRHERLRVADARDRSGCGFADHRAGHPARCVRIGERSAAHHDRRWQRRCCGESAVRLGDSLRRRVSADRVVGSSRGQHAESRRSLSAAAARRRLHLHGQHVLVADLRCIEDHDRDCALGAAGREELSYFFCSSSSFGMPNWPSSSWSLRMSIEPTMFTIVNSRGSLAMMARPLARSCSTRM